jgi:hypothetical protein
MHVVLFFYQMNHKIVFSFLYLRLLDRYESIVV